MKKLAIISSVFLIAFIAVISYAQRTEANPSDINRVFLTGSNATTSPVFLTAAGATSSVSIMASPGDQADINMLFTASSTSAALVFTVEFSNDGNCAALPLTCNWYREDIATVGTQGVTHSANAYHTWTPATTTVLSKNVTIFPLGARFVKVNWSAATANGSLWAELATKAQRSSN